MKIAIYGAGKCGEYVIQEILACKNPKVEISIIIDNNPIYSNKVKYSIPIVDLECFLNSYSKSVDSVLITVWDELKAQKMAVSLLRKNYDNIYLIPEIVLDGHLPILNQSGELVSYIRQLSFQKPVLPYVEYHVSDYCNLKCKGCGHFSNLVTEKIFSDISEFKESLEGLSKRFKNIKRFRLMGGEPLCNPDLKLFIFEARKRFPYSDIRIATNGLLLPQIDKQTAEAIRMCGVTIDITQYPPTRHMIEKIVGFAQEKDLKIQMGSEITEFFKMIGSKHHMREEDERIYSECLSRECHFLRNGHLYVCCAPILLFENKDFLMLDIDNTDVDNASFDLIDGNEDGWQILRKLLVPFEFCKYCTDPEWFEWSISGKEAKREDWIIE